MNRLYIGPKEKTAPLIEHEMKSGKSSTLTIVLSSGSAEISLSNVCVHTLAAMRIKRLVLIDLYVIGHSRDLQSKIQNIMRSKEVQVIASTPHASYSDVNTLALRSFEELILTHPYHTEYLIKRRQDSIGANEYPITYRAKDRIF